MITVYKHGIILSKRMFDFESEGVLNPAVMTHNGMIHMFYRAVSAGNRSTLGYCILESPTKVGFRINKPLLVPEFSYESHGIEDPRIVNIDGQFMITYTAYDGVNALGALIVSKDLKTFEKKGVIVPKITYQKFRELASTKNNINKKYLRYNEYWKSRGELNSKLLLWDKNLIFFPEKINGYLYFIHRIKPDILITRVKELSDLTPDFWINYFKNFQDCIMISPKYQHEISYVGGGCPPIKTKEGWLIIYHGVHDEIEGYVYSTCAGLFELDNPNKEIARLPYPLFQPKEIWEMKGIVNNVCFPSGSIVEGNILYIYYGAADERIGCASTGLQELINEILANKN